MKTIFLAFFLLNFFQPQAATLQISGVVPEPHVIRLQTGHPQNFIHPRHNCRVYYATVSKSHWQAVHKPTPVKSSCRVKVAAL